MFCLVLWLPPPPSPLPLSARCQLEARGMSSNLGLSPWWHHSHCTFRPQVGVIDEELAFWMCVSVTSYDIWHLTAPLKNWRILYANDTFHVSDFSAVRPPGNVPLQPTILCWTFGPAISWLHSGISLSFFFSLCRTAVCYCIMTLQIDTKRREKGKKDIHTNRYITYCILHIVYRI